MNHLLTESLIEDSPRSLALTKSHFFLKKGLTRLMGNELSASSKPRWRSKDAVYYLASHDKLVSLSFYRVRRGGLMVCVLDSELSLHGSWSLVCCVLGQETLLTQE